MRFLLLACLTLTACSNDLTHACAGAAVPANPQERDPQTGNCEAIDNGCGCDPCVPCACGTDQAGVLPECHGACDALDETSCLATKGCHTAYIEPLVPGPDPVATFWGCWDIAPLPVLEGGGCTSLDALTCLEHDDCTSTYGAAGGSADGVYAYCSANASDPPPAACSTLTTETACKARTDCEPVYVGSQCTCDPSTCTCAVETFDHCQTP